MSGCVETSPKVVNTKNLKISKTGNKYQKIKGGKEKSQVASKAMSTSRTTLKMAQRHHQNILRLLVSEYVIRLVLHNLHIHTFKMGSGCAEESGAQLATVCINVRQT